MTVDAWRIVKRQYAASAFSGEGARLHGGRWNNPENAAVYTAGSVALAVLEMLVHLDDADVLDGYSVVHVRFDEGLVEELGTPLPAGWPDEAQLPVTRAIGDAWIERARLPVLRVPSAVVPQEWNYLLNPRHARFAEVEFGSPEPFPFDPRLFRAG